MSLFKLQTHTGRPVVISAPIGMSALSLRCVFLRFPDTDILFCYSLLSVHSVFAAGGVRPHLNEPYQLIKKEREAGGPGDGAVSKDFLCRHKELSQEPPYACKNICGGTESRSQMSHGQLVLVKQ